MIETRRFRLRPPVDADAGEVLAMMCDGETRRWNPATSVEDLDTAAHWCRRMADWTSGDHATWAVVDRDSDAFLGCVSIHSVNRVQSDAEIGYRVAPHSRGRGVATEAVAAATVWAFDHLALVRIELAHAVPNPASCVVAERAGYRLEGVLRQSFVYGDGQRYDEHLHARLATDSV
ncbi:MAG TPA: GNAT family protein [Micromonosporaceae bacterium]|nr:GNAT family protein [Micromonosporaceae bacterium]